MTLPRRTNFPSRRRAFARGLLDPSSEWALDDYAVALPIASEPYDWTLEDDAIPFPQFIPVPPPAQSGLAASRQTKRKAHLSEAALLIPIKRAKPQRAKPRRKRLISSVLLLLLSVVAVFVFAYITQKHGR
jgi:hypothetical protein